MGNRKTLDKYYWLLIKPDKYELPIYVAESVEELSEVTGVKPVNILASYYRGVREGFVSKYQRIPKEEYKILR